MTGGGAALMDFASATAIAESIAVALARPGGPPMWPRCAAFSSLKTPNGVGHWAAGVGALAISFFKMQYDDLYNVSNRSETAITSHLSALLVHTLQTHRAPPIFPSLPRRMN